MHLAIALAAVVGLAWPAAPASAQPMSDASAAQASDRADMLLKEGIALANQSKWAESKAKLEQAFELKKSYDIAGNLALVEDELGDHAAAANHLDFAIRTFPASGKPEHRQTLRDQMAKVQKTVGSIRFDLREPGCTVKIDGAPVETESLATGVYVAPGQRKVVVTKEGFKDFTSEEKVAVDAYVVVTVRMEKKENGGGAGIVTPQPGEARPLWPAFLLGGLSAVGVGVGIAGVVVAAGKDSDAEALASGGSCSPPTSGCLTDGQTLADERGTFNSVGTVGWIVGGTALVGMITYLLVPDAEAGPVRVDGAISHEGAWLGATLHF